MDDIPPGVVAGISITLLAVILMIAMGIGEWRLRRKRRATSNTVAPSPLLVPVCSTCLKPEDEHMINWTNEPLFCTRCHQVTTCYRALVRGPTLEARP